MGRTAALALTVVAVAGFTSPMLAQRDTTKTDTLAIIRISGALANDSTRGRFPGTPQNVKAAQYLAAQLARLGARPIGRSMLIPFGAGNGDTTYNVVAIFPGRDVRLSNEWVGLTAHFDGLGVGKPDATGDSIYNGYFDDAVPLAMVMDLARRFAHSPGDRPLVVMFFNSEEQGLVGSKAIVRDSAMVAQLKKLKILIGMDAGTPGGESTQYQLMGGLPVHPSATLADSLAVARGWKTVSAAPRPISDVYPFSQIGIPILFPIPSRFWKGYSDEQVTDFAAHFDHYHAPGDQPDRAFPWGGTVTYEDWIHSLVRALTNGARVLQ